MFGNKSQLISGVVIYVIIIMVITKLATGTLNPVEIFRGDSMFLKIVIGFLLFALVAAVVMLMSMGRLKDETCPGCSKPLLDFVGAYGAPLRCPFCRRWFHTKCFKANSGTVLHGCQQHPCPSARS